VERLSFHRPRTGFDSRDAVLALLIQNWRKSSERGG
jgi:hypothetical protein